MDFRSQLSAFQSGGGGSRSGGSGSGNRDYSPQRSPQRGYRGNDNHYGRGGGDDHRRPREHDSSYSPQSRGPPSQRRRYNESDRDGLGDLRHHGYNVPRGHPEPPTQEEQQNLPKHLALLLICIDELPYEHIWKEWCNTLNSGSDCHISLVCHAKYPAKIKSEWLRQRLLVHPPKSGRGNTYLDPIFLSRTPEWGSPEITRAMLDLLSAGLQIGISKDEKDPRFSPDRFVIHRPSGEGNIPSVDQFLYISETCLPVAAAQEFFDVMDNSLSWVNARHRKDEGTPKNAYENDQFSLINRRIPGQYRWKADQWVLLCRKHASQIIGIDRPHIPYKYQLWHSYREINASDEMYIPTTLALLGYLRFTSNGEDTQRLRGISVTDKGDKPTESATPENTYEFVKKHPITYTDWTTGARNPATFANGLKDFKRVSMLARDMGCLVARKFAPYIAPPGVDKASLQITGQLSVEEWRKEIDILKEQYKDKKPKREYVPSTQIAKSPETEKNKSNPQEKEEGSNEEEGAEVSLSNTVAAAKNDDDDDDDDEENQL